MGINMEKAPKYITEKLWTAELPKELSNSYLESRDQQLPRVIYPDIRVLTANKGTQNDTYYPEESLRGDADKGTGLISFNRPYPVPILRDHLDAPSADGRLSSEVYGRVYHPAQMHANGGRKFVRVMATITHPEAIEGILTGRWLTTSLGSRTDSVQCSICRAELQESMCDHQKGKMYELEGDPEKQKCRWVIGPIKARELSFVCSPSDDEAGVLTPNLKESVEESLARMAERSLCIPRLLVGDDKGIWDLGTGVQVVESELFARPTSTRIFGGLSPLGSSVSLKENQVSAKVTKQQPLEPISEEEATKWMKEDFIGPGKYLLSGWDHDHTVVLDQRGDGTSTPGRMPPTQSMSPGYMYPTNSASDPTISEAGAGGGPARGRGMGDGDNTRPDPAPVQTGDEEDHTHEVLGGRVMKAGYPTHSHDMEPAHAALERARLEKNMPDIKTPEATTGDAVELDTEAPVTLGVLYNLPEDHPEFNKPDDVDEALQEAKLSYAARKNLDAGAFCGPDRSFPAHDAAHVRNGLARLSQSNFTAEQKSKIHGCLSGRAKKYGIKVGGKEGFAAKLVDTTHHIEFGLYAYPTTFEETETLLAHVKQMPHTPAEKEAIHSRIAAHCQDILPMSSWQYLFGELSLCEAGEPVNITINAENYGLLYNLNASNQAVPLTQESEKKPDTDTPTDKQAETNPDDPTKVVEADAVVTTEAKEVEGVPIIPLPKIEASTPTEATISGLDSASDIVRETMKNLQTKASQSENMARLALAHSAALYMKTLRKPLSRGKSTEELISELTLRTTDSLKDTLNDLLQEIDSASPVAVQTIPKVEDPTKPDTGTTVAKEAGSKDAGTVAETAPQGTSETPVPTAPPVTRLTPLLDLTHEEGEEEETWSIMGTLFEDLKVAPKHKRS